MKKRKFMINLNKTGPLNDIIDPIVLGSKTMSGWNGNWFNQNMTNNNLIETFAFVHKKQLYLFGFDGDDSNGPCKCIVDTIEVFQIGSDRFYSGGEVSPICQKTLWQLINSQ